MEISRLMLEEVPEGSGLCTHSSGSQQLPARCRHLRARGPGVPGCFRADCVGSKPRCGEGVIAPHPSGEFVQPLWVLRLSEKEIGRSFGWKL